MANTFSNDGSFLEQFLKAAPQGQETTAGENTYTQDQQQQQAGTYTDGDPYAQAAHDPYQNPYMGQNPYMAAYSAYGYPYPQQPYPAYPPAAVAQYGATYTAQSGTSDEKPTRSIWLGNVHPDTSEQEILAEFQAYGYIENIKIVPHKNCAFLNFADINSAIAAHSTGFGKIIHGQEVRIGWGRAEARETKEVKEDTGPKSKNLWIGNLGPEVTEDDIREKFAQFGKIESIKLLPHKNCGFVNYDSIDSAQRAKRELYGQYIGGRPMKINYGRIEAEMPAAVASPAAPGPTRPYSEPVAAQPPPAPPPQDKQVQNVIDKMVEFVARNGPAFERMMREKERDNPRLQFLFEGDEHHPYYQWKLWCLQAAKQGVSGDTNGEGGTGGPSSSSSPTSISYGQSGLSRGGPAAPPPIPPGAPPPPPPTSSSVESAGYPSAAPPGPLSAQDRRSLDMFLQRLDGTKDPIKQGKDWIFMHSEQAEEIAEHLRAYVEQSSNFDTKLHVLYLISDTLHHALARRTDLDSLDSISEAFKLPLVFILRSAYQNQIPEHQAKVIQLLKLWESRHIYGTATISRMENAVTSSTPPLEPPHTLSAAAPNLQNAYAYNYSTSSYPQRADSARHAYSSGAGAEARGFGGDFGESDRERKRRRSPSPHRRREDDSQEKDRSRDRDRSRDKESSKSSKDRREKRRSGWDQ